MLIENVFDVAQRLAERMFDGPWQVLSDGRHVQSWPMPERSVSRIMFHMNPDEIKAFIEENFPGIISTRRSTGWAFYLGEVRKGANSTRIARAIQEGNRTRFKQSVSARIYKNREFGVSDPDAGQVRALFELELGRWKEHFQ